MNEQLKQIAHTKEDAAPSEQQKVFYEHWKQEAARATQAEKVANQHARDRMKGLSSLDLRKIGGKQVLWGAGLSVLNGVGAFLGAVGGYGLIYGAGTVLGASMAFSFAPMIGAVVGATGGIVAGADFARFVYEKVARKMDTSLPIIEKSDRMIGDISPFFTGGIGNPPMIAGIRNIYEGYNSMKILQ